MDIDYQQRQNYRLGPLAFLLVADVRYLFPAFFGKSLRILSQPWSEQNTDGNNIPVLVAFDAALLAQSPVLGTHPADQCPNSEWLASTTDNLAERTAVHHIPQQQTCLPQITCLDPRGRAPFLDLVKAHIYRILIHLPPGDGSDFARGATKKAAQSHVLLGLNGRPAKTALAASAIVNVGHGVILVVRGVIFLLVFLLVVFNFDLTQSFRSGSVVRVEHNYIVGGHVCVNFGISPAAAGSFTKNSKFNRSTHHSLRISFLDWVPRLPQSIHDDVTDATDDDPAGFFPFSSSLKCYLSSVRIFLHGIKRPKKMESPVVSISIQQEYYSARVWISPHVLLSWTLSWPEQRASGNSGFVRLACNDYPSSHCPPVTQPPTLFPVVPFPQLRHTGH
ncbi:hypothetical protein DFH08DRAFT_812965 [Mycena albidolilacea]|uniref:Uncharacterized protein n=1 Tax=Mycena albidolilacea TaxID=1033008 RepID=A0AAD6ZT70_9AGAR|nr:hypothetical protein DFH08DRAFT_812965 [Mycena albidolilacea]